jgi:hypothetical protein
MGCGWTAKATDYGRIQAVEAVNGGSLRYGGAEGPFSGIPFWQARLNQGLRLTAVGGSDNHDAGLDPREPGAIGVPTTVVHAPELSQAAILSAIRAGHVFVDVTGSRDRRLEVTAALGERTVEMGDDLDAPAGASLVLAVRVVGAQGGAVGLVRDGIPLGPLAIRRLSEADETPVFNLVSDGARHWIRAEVRGPDGQLWLLGNPIYLNTSQSRP